MGLLDKLLFWKRKDEFDFEELAKKQMPVGDVMMPEGLGEHDQFKEKSLFPETTSPFEPQAEEPRGERSQVSARGMPQRQDYPGRQQQNVQSSGYGQNRDLELINSKLDTLKAMLTSIEQRMAEMERASGIEQKKKQERLW